MHGKKCQNKLKYIEILRILMIQADPKIMAKDNYQLILDYIEKEEWAQAHRACLEILRFDPENIRIIRLKNKIESSVSKLNREAVKKDLLMLQPLWEQHKYLEILKYLEKLQPFVADYPPLLQIIKKAKLAYNKQVYEQQEQYYKESYARIIKLIEEKKFGESLRESEKLRLLKINEDQIKKLIKKIRSDWINNEIQSNQTLIQSTRYEDILFLYQNLRRIDPNSALLEMLIRKTKKDYQLYKVEEKKEFIYKGTEQIRTLYLLKKFDKALRAAKEILEIDPRNKEIKKLYAKSQKKYQLQLEKEVIAQMLISQKQYKNLYADNKNNFKRI